MIKFTLVCMKGRHQTAYFVVRGEYILRAISNVSFIIRAIHSQNGNPRKKLIGENEPSAQMLSLCGHPRKDLLGLFNSLGGSEIVHKTHRLRSGLQIHGIWGLFCPVKKKCP